MRLLTEAEFRALGAPVDRVDAERPPPFDFWPYLDAIPPADFDGHDCEAGHVSWVYRTADGKFEFVHVASEDKDIFMLLVLDLDHRVVHGHRLIDFAKLYGLR